MVLVPVTIQPVSVHVNDARRCTDSALLHAPQAEYHQILKEFELFAV
jgi:hypothetical protein